MIKDYNFKFRLGEQVYFIHDNEVKYQRVYGVSNNVNQKIESYQFLNDRDNIFYIDANNCHKTIQDLTNYHEKKLNP